MKLAKRLLALVLGVVLLLTVCPALAAEEGLTTITVLGYNQGNARMGYFKDSYAYEWLMEKTHELGIDLQINYVEADQYQTTMTTRLATGTDLADMMFLEVDNVTLNNLINRGMLTSMDDILSTATAPPPSSLRPTANTPSCARPAPARTAPSGSCRARWPANSTSRATTTPTPWRSVRIGSIS